MEPFDQFGTPLFDRIYTKMKGFARVLEEHGYHESIKSPNLFFKKSVEHPSFIFFADMRGTLSFPIWKYTFPSFYWRNYSDYPAWLETRIIQIELHNIPILGLHPSVGNEISRGLYGNGYCCVCGKDFQKDGHFCSPRCKNAFPDLYGYNHCKVCNKEFTDSNPATHHHLSYSPEKTILVCSSCHAKIHHSSKYPNLKPSDSRPKRQTQSSHHE